MTRPSVPCVVATFAILLVAGNPARAQKLGQSGGLGGPKPGSYPSIDGKGHNPIHPLWGSAGSALNRSTKQAYGDGTSSPAGADRPDARAISNLVCAQDGLVFNDRHASDFVWQWGQFLDHDIDLSPAADPPEAFDAPVPLGDPWFDPAGTGKQFILLNRSQHTDPHGVRQQVNAITSWIDGSQVYGSDEARAHALRTLDGTGRLRTSAGNLLPFNTDGWPNAPDSGPGYFLAGDVRCNEQVGLTSMHTLFLREHNWWAGEVAAQGGIIEPLTATDSAGLDDQIYLQARALVAAEIQAITYREFLPVLLGKRALRPWDGFKQAANGTINNEFSTAAYRVGHTMLAMFLLRLDASMQEAPEGHLSLAQAFFVPQEIVDHGIDSLLRGLSRQEAQQVDTLVVDPVRNFLFGPPGAGGLDLATLNIQRGRDHGLPDYNTVRTLIGLPPVAGFGEVSSNATTAASLAAAYGSVGKLDLWVGGIAEDHVPGTLVGVTFYTTLKRQFRDLRDGDDYWYENLYPQPLIDTIEAQTLAVIIRRNTGIGAELANDVFHVPASP